MTTPSASLIDSVVDSYNDVCVYQDIERGIGEENMFPMPDKFNIHTYWILGDLLSTIYNTL